MAKPARTSAPASLLDRLRAAVGPGGLIADERDQESYVVDWRGMFRGRTPAVVRPASTQEVAEVVRICAETGTAIVPQGGNTGMCGGATPSPDGSQVIVTLGRMN